MAASNCLISNYLENIFFCVQKFIQVWNYLRLSKFINFWVNYPFKLSCWHILSIIIIVFTRYLN